MIHADNESGHESFFRWLGELGANYDAILLSSIDRAILTLSAPILVSGQADSSRLVGAFGSRTLASKLPDNMSVCGPCLNHWGAEIYRILTAEINYLTKRKRVSIVPSVLHPAAMSSGVA